MQEDKARENSTTPQPSYRPVILLFFSGVVVSFFLFYLMHSWERDNQRIEFESRSRSLSNAVKSELNEYLGALSFLADFFNNSKKVDREAFTLFTHSALPRYPGIQAFSWNPVVTNNQREVYESLARNDGLMDFTFTERTDKGELIPAAERQEYTVVYYIEPMATNKAALGYDIASNPTRKQAIAQVFETGKLTATGRLTLVQETSKQFGILIFLPLYHKNAPLDTMEQRVENRKGLVVEVLRIGDVVESALKSYPDEGIDLYLYDTSSVDQRTLHFRPSLRHDATVDPVPENFNSELVWSDNFELANRQWKILFRPSKYYLNTLQSVNAWVFLFGALIITTILTLYLLKKIKHTVEIEWRANVQSSTTKKLEKEVLHRQQAEAKILKTNETLTITNRKLKTTQTQLVQAAKLASIGEICAGLAHELNQPLGAIRLCAQLIQRKQAKANIDKEKIDSTPQNIIDQVDRATKIMKHLKIFSRESDFYPEDAQLNELINESLILFNETLRISGVTLKIEPGDNLPLLRCDATQIVQVITNLLANARDAVADSEDKWIRVRSYSSSDMVSIDVEDNGCGIKQSNLAKVFDPFFTTKPVGKGTGLGMSISHGIIEKHNGKLTVASEEGKGSCFTMSLPLSPQIASEEISQTH